MKYKKKQQHVASKRIKMLVSMAIDEHRSSPLLSERYSKLARNTTLRFRIRNNYEIKQLYCKKCKCFIIPGSTSRIRIGRYTIRGIRITCLYCGHVYRKIIPQKQNAKENKDL